MTTPYTVAQGYVGQRESSNPSDLLNRFLAGDTRGMTDAQYAWCSRFVKRSAEAAGVDPKTLSGATDMARSWLNVGDPTDKPQKGDVAVFSRGDPNGAYGHVGYFDSVNPDGSIRIIGGNQGDQVSYANMPASRLLGYRRLPAGAFAGGQTPQATPGGAFAPSDVPPILQANYGRQAPAPDASSTVASATPAPGAPAPSLSSAFGKAQPIVGNLASGAASLFSGGSDKTLEAAERANATALNEEDQRQAAALRQMLQKRLQQKQAAFGSLSNGNV